MASPKSEINGAEKEERRLIDSHLSSDALDIPSSAVVSYTFEEGLNAAGVGRYQQLLMLYVGFAWVCDAMEMMLLSFLAPAADCEWGLNSAEKGLITSVVFIGMFVGSYIWGMLADSEGRKIGFLATAVFTAVWGFASALSPSYIGLLIFRSLVGLGLGGIAVAFSLFLEFVPTKSRGIYAILIQGFWSVGALFEAGVAWAVLPTLGWRYLLGISTIPLLVLLLFFPLLSESPRFLSMKGKTIKAERVLAKIARFNNTELPTGKLKSSAVPTQQYGPKGLSYRAKKLMKGMTRGLEELFSSQMRRTTMLLFIVWIINALMYYGLVLLTTELQSKGSERCKDGKLDLDGDAYTEIFVDTMAEFCGFICALFLIDNIGRRKSMMIFLFLCGMAMWPLILSEEDVYQTALLFIARATIVGSFNVIFVYTPELFPTDVRAFGLGMCSACSRFGGLIAPIFAVQLVDEGYSTVVEILFAALCFLACFLTFLIPIETMGRELHDTVEVEMTEPQHYGNTAVPSTEEVERL